jgi:hypothetical protein
MQIGLLPVFRVVIEQNSRNDLDYSLMWRNWQTRTAQDRVGQPLEVRILS